MLEWMLVKKYIKYDNTQPFISITSFLAFIGVALGVSVLMITMAITNGLSGEFKKKLFSMNYPLTIKSSYFGNVGDSLLNDIKKNHPDWKLSPYISEDAVLGSGNGMQGVVVYGVDFKAEKEVNSVIKKALKDNEPIEFEAVIGKSLARSVYLKNSKKIKFTFTNVVASGFNSFPIVKKFKINYQYSSGLSAYDSVYIYTTISSLRKLTQKTGYDGVHIFPNNAFEDIKSLKKRYPEHSIIGWWEQNSGFFEAQQLEEKALFIVLMIIILVASLNIISSLLISIMNRRKEIALLLALGASRKQIQKTFFFFGMIIGMGGIIAGILLGFLGIYILGNFDIISLPVDVYGTSTIPMDLETFDFISILIGSCIIILVSSIYPAYKASDINIIDILRYE
jgi:putative ABC transport system permease protein